jgi:tungstate transport system ATP-binding protein
MNTGPPILQALDLLVVRGERTVLQVDSLEIDPGQTLALIGPNGAGKTTLLQALAALLPPTRGRILFRGQAVDSRRDGLAYRRQQAMVFQEPLLFNTSVYDNVAAGLKLRGIDRGQIRQRVESNLERFGIAHLAGRPARRISGGEAQRTSLARAMATEPQILFLDEPFASLDPPTRETLIEDLEKVLRQAGTTAVITTHDRGEALRIAHRMAVLCSGRILQIDTPAAVFEHPADRFVAAFVGVENLLPARVVEADGTRLRIAVGDRVLLARGSLPAGSEATLCLRPEHVAILPEENGEGRHQPANELRGRVVKITRLEHFSRIHIDCGFPLAALTPGASAPRPGSAVRVAIDPSRLHLLQRDDPAEPAA